MNIKQEVTLYISSQTKEKRDSMSILRLEDVKGVTNPFYGCLKMEETFEEDGFCNKCICFHNQVLHFLFMQVSLRDKRFFDEYMTEDGSMRFFRLKKQYFNMIGGFIHNYSYFVKAKLAIHPRGGTYVASWKEIPLEDQNLTAFQKNYGLYDYENMGVKKEEVYFKPSGNLPLQNKIWIYSKQFVGEVYDSKQEFIDDFIRLRNDNVFNDHEQKDENF